MSEQSVGEAVVCDLTAWARKWKSRREGLVMQAAIWEIERLRKEVEQLRSELTAERRRSFRDSRICYRGFGYGVSSQWGIDSLRNAIRRDGHD